MKRLLRSRVILFLAAAAGMFLVTPATAQEVRNAVERHQDRQNIRQDKAALVDDVAHLDRLSDLVIEWNGLRASRGSDEQVSHVLDRVAIELRLDLAATSVRAQQAQRETRQAARELRRDRRDVRRDRREVQEGAMSGTAADVASAKHELREDRRDRRDDRRDLLRNRRDIRQAEEILQGKRAVASELVELQRQIDGEPAASQPLRTRQAALLEKYLALSQKEIKLGIREVQKDRRELREDRREAREGRLQPRQ